MGSIGGKASYRGITFESAAARVRAGENAGSVRVRPVSGFQRAVRRRLGRIPLLRGLTMFLQPGMWVILLLLLVNDALTIAGVDMGGGLTDTVLLIALAAACGVFWLVRRVKGGSLASARRYHAAEHMAINTFEARLPLVAENVAVAKRTHPRCGTNLAVIMLLLGAPVIILCPYGLVLLPVICAAYEIFLALPKLRWLKPLFAACLWVQRHVTTAAPGEKEIEVAVRGIKRLAEGNGK